jgi:uncharacterized repeat protein (TIGR02543 family)
VSARYENTDTFIFGGTNTTDIRGWNTAQSFTATQTGTVYVRVIVYDRSIYRTGTYGIRYTMPTYTVTFDPIYGSGTVPAQSVSPGFSMTIPDGNGLSANGYTFGSWNTNAFGTGTKYVAGSEYTPTASITLYAIWHRNYTVTFDINEGSGATPASRTISEASTIILPDGSGFSRSGYTFGGWNLYPTGNSLNYNAGSSYPTNPPTENITLYAKWHSLTPLTADVWLDGTIVANTIQVVYGDWYTFPVTSGTTYYIWWNEWAAQGQGDGTKTADVFVNVRYAGSNNWIFGGDWGWETARSFTATQTGTVEIRVIPFNNNSSYAGTYGIVYSTGATRPGL